MSIYLIVCLALLSHISFKASKVVVSLFAIDLGADPVAIGFLFAMYSIFPFLLAMFVGRLSDRIGTRVPVLLGTAGLAGGLFVPFFFPNSGRSIAPRG